MRIALALLLSASAVLGQSSSTGVAGTVDPTASLVPSFEPTLAATTATPTLAPTTRFVRPTRTQAPTEAPSTAVPSTAASTTNVPFTDAPSTAVPSTQAPATTDTPFTVLPSTDLPSTGVPSTAVPSTAVPSTDLPSTSVPSTDLPTTAIFSSVAPSTAAPTTAALSKDINTLNYALTLENLEHAFYTTGLQNWTQADFEAAGYGGLTYQYMQLISAHEAVHVAAITETILSLGGTPVQPCAYYNFQTANVSQFLAISLALESTGEAAYNGAINTLTNPLIIQTAASIATIEARQNAFLSNLLTGDAFLNKSESIVDSAFEKALLPRTVANIASAFLDNSCPDLSFINLVVPRANVSGRSSVSALDRNVTVDENDVNTLQYALTLENLEAAFYAHFVGYPTNYTSFGNVNVTGAPFFSAADFANTPNGTLDYIQLISAHEDAHVASIASIIQAVGFKPVTPCVYNFSAINSVEAFIKTAATLEATGTSAYDGAANTITDNFLLEVAATIATVEARHSFVLNNIYHAIVGGANATSFLQFPVVSGRLFNESFEPTLTPVEVINIVKASGLIVSCPSSSAFTLPVVSAPVAAVNEPVQQRQNRITYPTSAASQATVGVASLVAAGIAAFQLIRA